MKKVFILIVSALILGSLFTGCCDIANITGPATVNTDGDLYKCVTCVKSDSATGWGDSIKPKGTWFMYNEYPGGYFCGPNHCQYYIQAGNPKNGTTFIGSYWIEDNLDGTFTAYYDIDDRWVVIDKHLAISDDTMNFTAKPGQDDNANWGEPFEAEDPFFVFAHFAMDCTGQSQ